MKTIKILMLMGILGTSFIACTKTSTKTDQDELAQMQKEMATDLDVPVVSSNED